MYQYFTHFQGWIISQCVAILYFFIHLLVDGYLFSSHILAIMNTTTVNMYMFLYEHTLLFISHVYVSKSGIVESYSNLIFRNIKLPNCFAKLLHHFSIPPAIYEISTLYPLHLEHEITDYPPFYWVTQCFLQLNISYQKSVMDVQQSIFAS